MNGQRVTDARMDIDRMMYWVVCDCGAAGWKCERHEHTKCAGCGTPYSLSPLVYDYNHKKGEKA